MQENVDRFAGLGSYDDKSGIGFFKLAVKLITHLAPWNLALLWALVRRFRGEREDSAGRLLHVWWIAVFGLFSIAASVRSVYLLPMYPAIALIAGRAIASVLGTCGADATGAQDRAPGAASLPVIAPRLLWMVVSGIVMLDLGHVAASQVARHYDARRNSLLPFEQKVAALVPRQAPLYADPEVSNTDLMVLKFRLNRPIQAISGYLISSVESHRRNRWKGQILATLERKYVTVALIRFP